MPPVAAPTTSFSARTHARASSARSRPSPYTSFAANATAHSNAADDDSPAPSGTVSVTCTSSPPTACPCRPQRPQHPGDVARPARRRPRSDGVERHRDVVGLPVVGGGAVHGEQLVGARRRRDDRALGDRERQAQALGVVDVLPDEVDPPRRGPGARRHEPAARSRSAICSGVASLIHAPMPDSDPARNFSFPGALRSENSCRCSRVRSRPVWIGAWCHPAM